MPLTNDISELLDDPAKLLELIVELRKRGYSVELSA